MGKQQRRVTLIGLVNAYEAEQGRSYGRCRRLVKVLRAEIEEALTLGYDVKTIWAALRGSGHLDSSYTAFADALKHLGLIAPSRRRKDSLPAAQNAPLPTFVFPRPEEGPRSFEHNPRPQKKDL